jgi:hypothetical protein
MKKIGIGIIGGGLMGREMASAFARWCSLTDVEVQPELVAVADLVEDVRNWFQRIPSCAQITADYHAACWPIRRWMWSMWRCRITCMRRFTAMCWRQGRICSRRSRFGIDLGCGAQHCGRGEGFRALCALQLGVSLHARRSACDPSGRRRQAGPCSGGGFRIPSQQRPRRLQTSELEAQISLLW